MKRNALKIADYIGKSESDELEFKGRDAIKDRSILPRAACAFLNTHGGEIVVGLADDGLTIEALEDIDADQRTVVDRLTTSIKPTPRKAIRVEAFSDAPALLISVPPQPKGVLFATISSEGRLSVPIRVGDRIQPLDWGDIQQRLGGGTAMIPAAETKQSRTHIKVNLQQWIQAAEERSPWLKERGGLYAIFSVELEESADERVLRELLETALRDPSAVNEHIRSDSRHFSTRNPALSSSSGGDIDAGDPERGYRWLRVTNDTRGGVLQVRFAQALDGEMMYSPYFDEVGRSDVLDPRPLTQLVASLTDLIFWLAVNLEVDSDTIIGGLQLTRLRGRRLSARRLEVRGQEPVDIITWLEPWNGDDPAPVVDDLEWHKFARAPHQLAKMLIRATYRDFKHDDAAIPYWDEAAQRFIYR